jgi:hypothetical protein
MPGNINANTSAQAKTSGARKGERIMTKYVVMFQVEQNELMSASIENPFTYNSKAIEFDNITDAEEYAKKYKTGIIVEKKD